MHCISVIVPHYGDPEPTLSLLAALARQDGELELQLIVSDDLSPEPFPAVAGVEVVRRSVNGGFGSAVNSGVAAAKHPHVLVLNSDVRIGPRFVADLVEAAVPWQPALVSPRVLEVDGSDAWVGRRFPTVGQQVQEWLTPLVRFHERAAWHRAVGHDVAAHGHTAVVDWVVGAAMLIPTDVFAEVGGFDERFHMNSEEVDLQRRLALLGVRSVVVSQPSLVHEGGGSTSADRRRRWVVSSRLRYSDKWGGRRRLQASLTLATAVNFAVNGVRRLAGRNMDPLAVARDELDLIWRTSR